MDPQKNPSPTPSNDAQSTNFPEPPAAAAPSLTEEAANTDMPAVPMAGQKIEPQTSIPSSDAVPSAGSPAISSAVPTTPNAPFDGAPSDATATDSAAPADVGAPTPAVPVFPAKRRKRGLFVGSIAAAIALLLTGGVAAAYFGYYLPSKPENVLLQALANAVDPNKTKTVQTSGSLDVTMAEDNTKVSGSFTGTADLQNGAFDVSSEMDAVVTKVTFDARSVDGKTAYLKIGGLEGMSELLTGMSGLAEDPMAVNFYAYYFELLNDQWFEINESLVSQMGGATAPSGELTDMGRDTLVTAYHGNQFIVVKETLPDQAIKGADSYHYKIGIDKAKLKAFVTELKNSGMEEFKLTDDQLKSFNKTVDDTNFDAAVVEAWIAKDDKTFRQVVVAYADNEGELKVRLTVDSYNKPVEVEEPEDAKSLLELISGLLGGGLGTEMTMPTLDQVTRTGISL